MRVTLIHNSFAPRQCWTIHFERQIIPVHWSAWYRQHWTWPSGDNYLIDMQGEMAILHEMDVVARRKRPAWGGHGGTWEGIIPLTYTWRHCSVWFRGEAGELIMWARCQCPRREHAIVIRKLIDEQALPVLCGIAMATFLNYDD